MFFRVSLKKKFVSVCNSLSEDDQVLFLSEGVSLYRSDPGYNFWLWIFSFIGILFFSFVTGLGFVSVCLFGFLFFHIIVSLLYFYFVLVGFKKKWYK